MIWDSLSKRDELRRGGCAVFAAFSLALGGCAFSYEGADGRRQVVGLYAMTADAADPQTAANETLHFTFYGLWLDDAFRGASMAFGEVELSVADLRNQWPGDGSVVELAGVEGECSSGFAFRWCSLAPRDPARAGEAFDIEVTGITIGAGARDRHFGIGYHRQVLLEVTNENALVTWPAHVKLEGLLRGSING